MALAIAFPNTLTSINTMLLKVGQCKFYMKCALAFTRFSSPSSKMGNCQPLVGFYFLSCTLCKATCGDHTHLLKQSPPVKIWYFRPGLNDFYA